MSPQVIDEGFAGLAYPRQSFSLGREDLSDFDRPGPFLVALITAMTQDGKLDYDAVADPGMPGGYVPFADAPRPGADFRSARYLDDDDEPELGA